MPRRRRCCTPAPRRRDRDSRPRWRNEGGSGDAAGDAVTRRAQYRARTVARAVRRRARGDDARRPRPRPGTERDGVLRAVVACAGATERAFRRSHNLHCNTGKRTLRRRRFAHAAFPAPSRARATLAARSRERAPTQLRAASPLASPHGASSRPRRPPRRVTRRRPDGKPTFILGAPHGVRRPPPPPGCASAAPRAGSSLRAVPFPRPRAFATPTRANGFALARRAADHRASTREAPLLVRMSRSRGVPPPRILAIDRSPRARTRPRPPPPPLLPARTLDPAGKKGLHPLPIASRSSALRAAFPSWSTVKQKAGSITITTHFVVREEGRAGRHRPGRQVQATLRFPPRPRRPRRSERFRTREGSGPNPRGSSEKMTPTIATASASVSASVFATLRLPRRVTRRERAHSSSPRAGAELERLGRLPRGAISGRRLSLRHGLDARRASSRTRAAQFRQARLPGERAAAGGGTRPPARRRRGRRRAHAATRSPTPTARTARPRAGTTTFAGANNARPSGRVAWWRRTRRR